MRTHLEGLLDQALRFLPEDEPDDGWDSLMALVRSLRWSRRVAGWDDPRELYRVLEDLCGRASFKIVQKRWSSDSTVKKEVKEIAAGFQAFIAPDGEAQDLVDRWYASRYASVIRLVRKAADEFEALRLRLGRLSFQDLLLVTARLLRERPDVRRALGARYRHILVDEFQDTDPVQAEIVLLLASEPGRGGPYNWWEVVPRPGALFVVGDPKQSIYRFRRADIAIYGRVKARFQEFGRVLRLTANFRSRPDIAKMVNDVFGAPDRFPANETNYQAPFAPLEPQPRERPVAEGVFDYWVEASRVEDLAIADAAILASWIRRRVDAGERNPGDFLILTRKKKYLHHYARALEDRGLPIDASGAGVGLEDELEALMHLLETLVDPDDPVLVVGTLVGLFFGIDHEELVAHHLAGRRNEQTVPAEADTRVGRALRDLHRWWILGRTEPADVVVGHLVSELGLFPHAASSDLGSLRTGALAYAMDAIRAHAASGDTSLVGSLEALAAALEWEEAEAPLEPGRPDAVRLMNLHKAKGLEANVVVLAEPGTKAPRGRKWHVTTGENEERSGWVVVTESKERTWGTTTTTVARPLDWPSMKQEELRFEDAESDRLLYVAATRARDELVISRRKNKTGSPWDLFDAWLDEHGRHLDLEAEDPPDPPAFETSPDAVRVRVAEVDRLRSERAGATYRFESVTEVAKRDSTDEVEAGPDSSEGSVTEVRPAVSIPRGYEWGSVVHAALAAAARGLDAAAMREVARTLLIEQERPVDESGQPRELDELMDLVERVQASELWARALASPESHPEMPFATRRAGTEMAIPEHVEGVIDLVFREGDGWVIADYKTDVGDDPDFPRREKAYRRQVDLYAECWSHLTGEPIVERVLLFTAQDRTERW